MIYNSVLDMIGDTPLLKLSKLNNINNFANIYVKLEMFNPTGSVKDRSALNMVEQAEKEGLLHPNSILIESSSGNLGISLAMIAMVKGYKFICVLDPKVEEGKINALKAFKAVIVMVDKPDKKGGFQIPRINKVKELLNTIPNSVCLDQYNNPYNPLAHYNTTGPEIFETLKGKIDVIIGSVSTGGHLCGAAKFLKENIPNIVVVGVEPEGSVIFGGEYHPYLQQGTGLSFKSNNYEPNFIDEKIKVGDYDAFKTVRDFVQSEGILIGGSSGAVLHVAYKIAKELSKDKNIVAILPDHGDRYLNTIYSDNWLNEHQHTTRNIKNWADSTEYEHFNVK